jgi:hypothetical protein
MSKYFEPNGETIESPGMVRWYSKPSHYFLKRIGNMWDGIHKPDTFVLGLEHQIGDGAYLFNTSIEFDNDEAPDLMDRIADFNGLTKYTSLQEKLDKARAELEEFKKEVGGPSFSDEITKSKVYAKLSRILKGMD